MSNPFLRGWPPPRGNAARIQVGVFGLLLLLGGVGVTTSFIRSVGFQGHARQVACGIALALFGLGMLLTAMGLQLGVHSSRTKRAPRLRRRLAVYSAIRQGCVRGAQISRRARPGSKRRCLQRRDSSREGAKPAEGRISTAARRWPCDFCRACGRSCPLDSAKRTVDWRSSDGSPGSEASRRPAATGRALCGSASTALGNRR